VEKYSVFIKPSALKELESVGSKKVRQRIVKRIQSLADDPRPYGYRKLSGSDKYRIRCGDYRILFTVKDEELVVFVIKVAHRKEVYR